MQDDAIGLGWRVHSWRALVVAVRGSATSPEIVHREEITLIDDEATREPYHAACGVPIDEARALIGSVEKAAAAAAAKAIEGFVSSLGSVAAVGVVGGNRKVPSELSARLASHATLHASERDLYERAIIEGATISELPVVTIPATGKLLAVASDVLGVKLEPTLASLGRSVGRPWQKDHREATAAALVALKAAG
jgi:gamma-glutamyl-gamma-aminobutyrate hydrolase PuuD